MLHVSIPVAAMQPARPRMDKRKPTTWYVVVDMAFASGTLAVALEPAATFLLWKVRSYRAPEGSRSNQMVSLSSWCLLTVFSLDSSVSLLVQGHYFFIC